MEKEIESIHIAGHLIKFVYIDPIGNRIKDYEFMARCHFLPSRGDEVVLGETNKKFFVKNIYHSFVQNDDFEKNNFCQIVTVVVSSERSPEVTSRQLS